MRKLAGFALGFLVGDYLAGLIIHRAEQRLALLTLRACHRLLDGVEALAVGQPERIRALATSEHHPARAAGRSVRGARTARGAGGFRAPSTGRSGPIRSGRSNGGASDRPGAPFTTTGGAIRSGRPDGSSSRQLSTRP